MPTLVSKKPKGEKARIMKGPVSSKGGKVAVEKTSKAKRAVRVKNLPVGAIVLDDDFFAMQEKFGGDNFAPPNA